jgi:hypothetical protein
MPSPARARLNLTVDPAVRAYVDEVADDVRRRLLEQLNSADGATALAVLGPPAEAAELMVSALPQPSPWADAVGPVYRTPAVRRLLGGVSRQALVDRARRHTLLALRTADDHLVWPTFQFQGSHPLAGLARVLGAFDRHVDEWTLAGWLRTEQAALDNQSVVDWLRAGGDVDRAVELAAATAARWQR